MKPRTSAITEIVLFVHWLDAPRPATWQALKPLIEVWIGQPNPDFPKVVGLSYCPGANRQALELLIGRLDDYGGSCTSPRWSSPPSRASSRWRGDTRSRRTRAAIPTSTAVNGSWSRWSTAERPEPRVEGDSPANSPQDALRRTIEFLGSSDGYRNHWYVYDQETGVLHQFEQEASGQTLALVEDASFNHWTFGGSREPGPE